MTPLESLLLEAIPVRISRAPSTESGPTEQLRIREAHQALWRGEFEQGCESLPETGVNAGRIETAPRGLEPCSTPDQNSTCAHRRRTG